MDFNRLHISTDTNQTSDKNVIETLCVSQMEIKSAMRIKAINTT